MDTTISWDDFQRVVIAVGTIVRAEPFPQARHPAYRIWADFGPYGEKKTSAQIADLYRLDDLPGRQIIGVLNFPPKQIGPMRSEFLLTGFHSDAGVVISQPERAVPNGSRLA
jgi:tRNA-binding protein